MAEMNATQTRFCLTNLPIQKSILIAGDHGKGKSETVKQAAQELDVSFIDMRLSQNDVGDIKGMPFHENGRTFFAPPDWFPIQEKDAKELSELLGLTEAIAAGKYGDKGILHLDELNRATREVQQAAFELVLDRRLNMRSLPDGWRVVASINDNSDIYIVNEMEPALLSRFFLINFNPSIDEWLEWADNKEDVHPSVVQFIRKKPDLLDPTPETLKEAVTKGVVKIQDRRSWSHFAQAITELEKKHEQGLIPNSILDKSSENIGLLILIGGGFVGNLCAIDFARFIETDYQSLDAEAMLNRWNKEIEDHVKEIVKAGNIPELGSCNDDLLAYIKKNVKSSFNKTQSANLAKYLGLLPKEIVADFWVSLSGENSKIAEQWYRADKKHTTIVVEAIVKKTK